MFFVLCMGKKHLHLSAANAANGKGSSSGFCWWVTWRGGWVFLRFPVAGAEILLG